MPIERRSIDFLAKYPTTVLESAVALFRVRPRTEGVVGPGLRFYFPAMGRLVGRAVTSIYSTDPIGNSPKKDNLDYWNYVSGVGGPKIAVALDVSEHPGRGSSWGVRTATIHKALGCRGVVTNGGIRDIDSFESVGFSALSPTLTVGHGYPHLVNFGGPVQLLGATIHSGDVICADQQGAILIPEQVIPEIEDAIEEIERRGRIVTDYCRSPGFTPQGLAGLTAKLEQLPPWKPAGQN